MVSRGGPFESLDITSFLDNPLLCGSISGLLRCPKNKRQKVVFIARDRIDVRCNIPQPQESKFPRRLIGTGSYGEVYRGELKDGREVAIKVLKTQELDQEF
ncbi:hypothetical protein EJ110_NYTH19440 [Nymphaea thermarum]|nr:hypothetical protein EJ110_NYTH19440 [Nymphaea thermarum]